MKEINKILVFTLMKQNYAIDIFSVEKCIQAVEIMPVPENIATLLGVINFHGRVIPVLDIRKKLGLPFVEINIDNYIVIVNISGRLISFIADTIVGVIEFRYAETVPSADILPLMHNIDGILKINGDMILIHDLEKALSFEAKQEIDILAEIRNG